MWEQNQVVVQLNVHSKDTIPSQQNSHPTKCCLIWYPCGTEVDHNKNEGTPANINHRWGKRSDLARW